MLKKLLLLLVLSTGCTAKWCPDNPVCWCSCHKLRALHAFPCCDNSSGEIPGMQFKPEPPPGWIKTSDGCYEAPY